MGTQVQLSDEALVYAQDTLGIGPEDVHELTTENPYIPAVIEILAKRARRILEMEHQDQSAEVKDMECPFPEGTNMTQLPQHVLDSSIYVQKLSPEIQSKISYYEKGGEWYINLDGIKISLQNESAERNPEAGINVINGNTYFSQSAALAHAENKGQMLPTNALWIQMADFLGGFEQLHDVLQIPPTGWLLPGYSHVIEFFDKHRGLWSANSNEGIIIGLPHGNVEYSADLHYGLSVRLLDN